jgi:hypothetical protein
MNEVNGNVKNDERKVFMTGQSEAERNVGVNKYER